MKLFLTAALIAGIPFVAATGQTDDKPTPEAASPAPSMDLGAFSVSLPVKNLAASRDFYAKLGFKKLAGDEKQNYLILKNGTTVIGLFQGMFEDTIMTFNPGWDQSAAEIDPFTDVRKLQAKLMEEGIKPTLPIAADALQGEGPASFMIADPDGNTILFDQHR